MLPEAPGLLSSRSGSLHNDICKQEGKDVESAEHILWVENPSSLSLINGQQIGKRMLFSLRLLCKVTVTQGLFSMAW